MAIYAVLSNSLWSVCAWHTLWNWSSGHLIGFIDSSDATATGLLFNLKLNGLPFLTGGEFGTDNSFFLTVVLLCGVLLMAWRLSRAAFTSKLLSHN